MKKSFYLFLLLVFLANCNKNNVADELIDYTKENYQESNTYFLYGSVVRAVVNVASKDKSGIEALKDLEKFTYFNIPTANSKMVYKELMEKTKSYGLTEYITIEKGSLNSIPEQLQSYTMDAKEISVLIKDENGVANNLVIILRKKEAVVFLVSDGDLEIKKLMEIKLDNTDEIENTFKNLPNIF